MTRSTRVAKPRCTRGVGRQPTSALIFVFVESKTVEVLAVAPAVTRRPVLFSTLVPSGYGGLAFCPSRRRRGLLSLLSGGTI